MSLHPSGGALRRAMAVIGAAPFQWCGAVLACGVGLGAIVLAAIVGFSARGLLEQGGIAAQASVLIAANASRPDADALRASLLRLEPVTSATFVSRDAALAQIAARSAADREAIGQLAANPLPDAFTVMFRADAPADLIEACAGTMRKLPHVDAVQLDLSWYRKLRAGLRVARLGTEALLALSLASALGWWMVALALCVRIDAAEVALLRLLGADDRLIRRPAFVAGALTGFAVSLVALCAARFAWIWLDAEVSALAGLYSSTLHLLWPEPPVLAVGAAAMVVASALLAAVGARGGLRAVSAGGPG